MVRHQLGMATLRTEAMAHLLQDMETLSTTAMELHQHSMATLRMGAMGHLRQDMETLSTTAMELHPQITATLVTTAAKSFFA